MLGNAISKDSILLALFAIVSTGLCVATYEITKDKIELNRIAALEKALYEVVPKTSHSNNMLSATTTIAAGSLGNKKDFTAYLARNSEGPVAAVFPVTAPEGYGGPINLLIGVYADGTIAGVRVIPPHKETPGLGDKIELKKSEWILEFTGTSLNNPKESGWGVKKDGGDFDSFTGATITPRAVVKAVQNTLQYFKTEKSNVFNGMTKINDNTLNTSNRTGEVNPND